MWLADRMEIPDQVGALLFDLDGVIVDTLTPEYSLVNRLLAERGVDATIEPGLVRKYFATPIPDFWRHLLAEVGAVAPAGLVDWLVEQHESLRLHLRFPVHEGIRQILAAAEDAGLRVAVVSNNPRAAIEAILARVGVAIGMIIGNDGPGLRAKPAPDMYLEATRRVDLAPARCIAVEDSLIGAQAAAAAGCVVIGVATGADDFGSLSSSAWVHRAYRSFSPRTVRA